MPSVNNELIKKLNNIESKLDTVLQNQQMIENRLYKVEQVIKKIDEDIYLDEDEFDDFDIVCPYCNNEFTIDLNENKNEVKCPECKNTIELDWSGNVTDDEIQGFASGCAGCGGCGMKNIREIKDEDDDM